MNDRARILFFATLRDITGVKEYHVDLTQGMTIADIKSKVLLEYPNLNQYVDSMIIAMNHEFASEEDIIPNGAEIAMFPPVSGGDSREKKGPTLVAITEKRIDINELVTKITLPTTGGICTFAGTVREVATRGELHETQSLEYEAYHSMAEEKLIQICSEIRSRWKQVEGIALVQRIGKLKPGEVSVVVACSSSHRDEGIFDAAHYGIDRLKEIVPVWKKEIRKDGEEWIEGGYIPHRGD